MPSLQVVDLSEKPRTEPTTLERTLSSFADQYRKNQAEQRESDALTDIYKQYQSDGSNLEKTIQEIQTRPGISPTTRVNTVNQLLKFQEHNQELQKNALKQQEDMRKKEANQAVIADIETRRGLKKGELAAYENDPKMAEQLTRPAKETKVNQADRPIDPDQLRRINHVRSQPGFDDLDEVQQYRALTNSGVSQKNAESESKLTGQKLDRNEKAVDSAYKSQEKFINDTTSSYKAFETDTKPKLLQMQKLATDDQLVGPVENYVLDVLHVPLGALEDPSSELYNKLSLDLLKGLPETYGNRILKVEVDNFLKTVPGLANSPNGRRMIASNILKLGEMKEVYYNEMRNQQREYLDNNKPLPRDFQQKVFDQVKPQVDRINNDFVRLSEVKDVPKDTIPFFDPNGEVSFVPKEHAQWAMENGGRRIW